MQWQEIADMSADNDKQATRKQVLALGKLAESIDAHSASIFNLQRVTGNKLEDLTSAINNFNQKSGELGKKANAITVVIAASAVIQLVVTLLR